MQLRGCGTALVTPFHQDGSIDEPALRNLVAWQVESGIDFLIPCGTTGETPTLTHDEWLQDHMINGVSYLPAATNELRPYFAKHGLPKQFTAVGYGASRPLSVAENRAGLQRNRRIELRVKGQPEL